MNIERKLTKRKIKLIGLAEAKDVDFMKVLEIYTLYSAKIYTREKIKEIYNDHWEDYIYDLTERWVGIYK